MAHGELLTLDPITEDAGNAPLALSGDEQNGVALLAHDYPTPDDDAQWVSSSDMEGELRASTRPTNRRISIKVRVAEPSDPAATNLVTVPSFELPGSITPWTGSVNNFRIASGATLSRDTSTAAVGDACLDVFCTATSFTGADFTSVAVVNGTTYRVSMYVRGLSGGEDGQIIIGDGTVGSASLNLTDLTTTFQRFSFSFTATGTGTTGLAIRATNTSAPVFLVDGVSVVAAATLTTYFDGDTPGCAWTGAAHASTSTRQASGGDRYIGMVNDIEAKVAKLNRDGGTLRRIFPSGQSITFNIGAARVVGEMHDKAATTWRRTEVDLEFVCAPYGRGAEVDLGDNVETTLPCLVFTDTSVPGDVPALGRLVIDNDAAAGNHWWGLLWGAETNGLYAFTDSTGSGALFYQAESRTAMGGSAVAVGPSGASGAGSNVVRNTALSSTWVAILSTQASGGGAHLTHVGGFRVFARVQGTNAGTVSVSWEWSHGDFRTATRNRETTLRPDWSATWRLVDLGLVNVPKPQTGVQHWEGRVLAKSTFAGDDIDIDWLLLVPHDEGSGVAQAVFNVPAATSFTARDEFDQAAGALTGKTAPIGGTWAGAGDADDFSVETTGKTAQRTAVSDLWPTGRFAVSGASAIASTLVSVDVKANPATLTSSPKYMGVLARYTDVNNWCVFLAEWDSQQETAVMQIIRRVAGVTSGFANYSPVVLRRDAWYTLRLLVDAQGRAVGWYSPQGGAPGDPVVVTQNSALATGGALASGKVGFFDCHPESLACTRNFDNFAAWAPTEDAAIFAGQSLAVRHDGVIREDSTGTDWPGVSNYVGDYLRIPPSGAEGRTARFVVKPLYHPPETAGAWLDDRTDDLSARLFVTPRGLVVPEP